MTPESQSLIVTIAGIAGTVVMGTIGLFFTARSRTSPNRQILYTKQVELGQRIFKEIGYAKTLAILLMPDSNFKEQARDDLRDINKSLHLLRHEAVMLYPTEIFIAASQVADALTNLLTAYDESSDITKAFDTLEACDIRFALMIRLLVGVDELSIETLSLHSSEKALMRLSEMNEEAFLSIIRARRLEDGLKTSDQTNAPSK